MKCLVSGATGFVGRQLCPALIANGHDVVALSKSGGSLNDGTPTQAVDLSENDLPAALLHGVDVVIHLAGIAHQQAPPSAYEQLNHLATLRLARLAATAGARSFIYLSSVKAMGAPDSALARSESDCTVPTHPYGLSKWKAECVLREEFADAEMSVVILRPALVYGINVKGNLARLATAVGKGLPRPPAAGERSMIAVDDLVDLLCHLAKGSLPGVHTWIACGSRAYSTRDIHGLIRAALGKGQGIQWLPLWAWRCAARVLDGAKPAVDGDSTYEKLFAYEVYSNTALISATAWRPKVHLEQLIGGIADSGRGK
ncbi:MAG: nucleoside-diphosphate-sugar epimerase [Halioglobus sp.]